jgi:hypothetical protein
LPANVRCSYSAYVNDNSSSYIKLLSDTASGYYTLSAKSAFMSGITAYFTYQLTITSGDNVSNNNGTQTIKKIISVHMGTIYSKAENIYFANTTLTSLKNKTFNVQPIILPVANTKKGVTWTSSNPDVATVDSSGNVHTLKIGTTTISAKTTDQTNLSASYKLNVVPDAPAAPSLSESTTGIQLTWRSIAGIVSYEIYRAETSNGEYTKIATVNSTSYIDKPAYGKTYYYKLTAIPSLGSTYTSSFGNAKSLKHMPATPSIKKIKKKSKKIISISIRGNTYDGFVIYMGRKKNTKNAVNIIKGKNCSLSVKRKRSYYIRVRAYVIQDGKKIYSRYSTAVKYKNK